MPVLRRRNPAALLFCLILLIGACAGPRETRKDDEPKDAPPVAVEKPPARSEKPKTDAPPRKEPNTPRTVQGFRIQLDAVPEKNTADRQVSDAVAWWKTIPADKKPDGLGNGSLQVYITWRQPLYRIRVGNFTSQEEARQALLAFQRRYPNAIVVPDMVRVSR